jgi:predicted DNA-binding protein
VSDVLSKIKAKRNRATVPAREDFLLKQNPPIEEENNVEGSDSLVIATDGQIIDSAASSIEQHQTPIPSKGQIEALRAQLEKYPEIIRHSAIRLEKELDSRLTRFCKENGCTIETFLEAAFEEAEADASWREKILKNALNRYASRKKAGKLRQLITQLEKAEV